MPQRDDIDARVSVRDGADFGAAYQPKSPCFLQCTLAMTLLPLSGIVAVVGVAEAGGTIVSGFVVQLFVRRRGESACDARVLAAHNEGGIGLASRAEHRAWLSAMPARDARPCTLRGA
jgi:hypothetical protein